MGDHYREGPRPTEDTFRLVLAEVSELLEGTDLRVLVMGGVGSASLARPRRTDDIDLFVHVEDADDLLAVFEAAGYRTERHDPNWLYKAFRRDVLIDIIFRSTGDIVVDEPMLEHADAGTFKGSRFRLVSPEDLLVIKAVAAAEHSPHHWYDALGLVARCDLDWDYLVERARRFGPRRVLSLLLYAESNDLAVPPTAVDALSAVVHPARYPEVVP
jgi:predicted nucleotidyltransferase